MEFLFHHQSSRTSRELFLSVLKQWCAIPRLAFATRTVETFSVFLEVFLCWRVKYVLQESYRTKCRLIIKWLAKSACCPVWPLESNPQDPRGWRRELILLGCPLTSTCAPKPMCVHAHKIHLKNFNVRRNYSLCPGFNICSLVKVSMGHTNSVMGLQRWLSQQSACLANRIWIWSPEAMVITRDSDCPIVILALETQR